MDIRCYCPELTREEFNGFAAQKLNLSGKTFYASKVPMVSHFPINPEVKLVKMLKEIEQKGYQPIKPIFALFEDGMFMGRAMIEIKNPGAKGENLVTLPDLELILKIFTGPKFLVPKAMKEFDKQMMTEEKVIENYYFWYHSCRVCEGKKGSRTVIGAKL